MLSENIKKLRKSFHLSQVELARELGVSKQCVSNWENDNIQPSIDMLTKMAKFFNVSCDFLLGLNVNNVVSIDGLNETEVAHIKLLIEDLRLGKTGQAVSPA